MSQDFVRREPFQQISFEEFWQWLQMHFNCILRAGSMDVAVFDSETLHWRFSRVEMDSCLVQVAQGKAPLVEMALQPSNVSFVQVTELGEEEYLYELVFDDDGIHNAVYFFVLSHAFDEEDERNEWMN